MLRRLVNVVIDNGTWDSCMVYSRSNVAVNMVIGNGSGTVAWCSGQCDRGGDGVGFNGREYGDW